MSKITKITAFFLFFVMCFCVQNVFALVTYSTLSECTKGCDGTCTSLASGSYICSVSLNPEQTTRFDNPTTICLLGQKCCKVDGVDTCVDESTSPCLTCTGSLLNKIETCTKGETETVHTAIGCTYTTKERTCCDGLSWSGWGGKCCSGDTPERSKTCVNSAGYSGTQTRTVSCNNTTGEWNIGEWSACSSTQECDPGAVRTGSEGYCNNNKYHQQVCDSNGKWGACGCINQPDKYYKNMPYPIGSYVVNGYWSSEACYGMCCCEGHYPVMITAVGGPYEGLQVPQCKGKNEMGVEGYTYACTCIGTTVDQTTGSDNLYL